MSTISPIRHQSPANHIRDITEPGRPRPAKLCQENPQRFRHHRIVPWPQITGNRKHVGSRNPNLCISLCRVAAQSLRKNTPSTALGTIAQGPPDARRLLVFTESCLLRQVERIPRIKGGGTSTQWWSLGLWLRGDGEEIRGGGHGARGEEATEKLVRRPAQED
ncbi:hypothetical protein DY000_02061472 [Brassica cretica]|uniref:Uncharacterized protein n=1 Tax=Brassica cretica TaxID=69181 RepID=A0ABQ7AU77_BRACR|nr:hypothetical protein DY000_02061472 [Brassica cretica]